MDPNK